MYRLGKQLCLLVIRNEFCRNPEAAFVVTPKRQLP